MTTEAWLKSGIIGGTVTGLIALILMLPVPALNCCGYPLMWAFFAGTGVLAAHSLPAHWGPRIVGGMAAAAGFVASFISGLALVLASVLQTVLFPEQVASLTTRAMESLPADLTGPLGDPATWDVVATPGSAAVSGSICCGANLIVGIVLAAVGGLVWNGLRRL
jgi:hypothetical protein